MKMSQEKSKTMPMQILESVKKWCIMGFVQVENLSIPGPRRLSGLLKGRGGGGWGGQWGG